MTPRNEKNMTPRNRRLTIPITAEGIAAAVERDSSHCVIADAIRAARPDVNNVTVDLQTIRFTDPTTGRRYVFLTPTPLQQLLVDFDQGVLPTPRSFYLGNPIQTVAKKPKAVRAAASAREKQTKAAKAVGADVPPPSGETSTSGKGAYERPETEELSQGVYVKRGGQLPPTAAYSNTRGRRRVFGARGLRP